MLLLLNFSETAQQRILHVLLYLWILFQKFRCGYITWSNQRNKESGKGTVWGRSGLSSRKGTGRTQVYEAWECGTQGKGDFPVDRGEGNAETEEEKRHT